MTVEGKKSVRYNFVCEPSKMKKCIVLESNMRAFYVRAAFRAWQSNRNILQSPYFQEICSLMIVGEFQLKKTRSGCV